MKKIVRVEKVGDSRYCATVYHPLSLKAEGASTEEALERLYDMTKQKLADAKLFQVNLLETAESNPWKNFAGIWKDHPDFDAFVDNIAKNRLITERSSKCK